MAASDSRPVPIKNTAYRVIFPILDADGDLVTGAATLDSEVSKDCGTFADCTNEATEIATSSGVYYLDLTSTEMNADSVAVIVKTGTAGAKTTTIVLYPQESGDIKVDVQSYGGTAGTFSGGRPEVNTTHAAGTAWGSGAITAASIAADAITAAKIADGAIDSNTFAAGAITASAIAADAIGASELAADAVAEISDAVWDEARAGHVSVGSFGEGVASVQGNVTGSIASVTAGVTVTTNNDKTGYGLSATAVQAIWDALTSALTTVGSIGKLIVDNLNATVSSRLASASYTAPLDAAGTRAAVGLASANLDTQLSTIDTVVDSILVDTAEIGLAGAGLTALASQTSVNTIDDYIDTEVAAIKAKTDLIPAAPAAVGDIPTAVQNADAILGRNVAGGSNGTRTVSEALYVLRNKSAISAGTLTVYGTDDTTPAFTATVATTAGDPISSIDPA